jgi:hypothetical protein
VKKLVIEIDLEHVPTVGNLSELLGSLATALPKVIGAGRILHHEPDGRVLNEARLSGSHGGIICRSTVVEGEFSTSRTIFDGCVTDGEGNEKEGLSDDCN